MVMPAEMKAQLKRRLDAALGKMPCELVLKNARYLDVFACCFRHGDIAIADGVIVGLGADLEAGRVLDLTGRTVVPGFIDAHVHVESSLMLPHAFEHAVLRRGTTTAVCDPHEIANVVGAKGLSYFLEAASGLNLDLWVMLSSCVPATHLETNGGGTLSAQALLAFADHPKGLGLAEMMNVPGVLAGDDAIVDKLVGFCGRPLDGHAPLLSGRELAAYAACGISSCHESSQLEEAKEKLSFGMGVWIREGSVAKDLEALAPLLTLATSTSVGFCTDDRNPFDIAEEGHLDHLVRGAIRSGVPAEVAYRAASWSVARHYGLTAGPLRVGAVAPGYQADLVVLDDVVSCAVGDVLKRGALVADLPRPQEVDASALTDTVHASVPEGAALEGPSGPVHVIGVVPGKILTEHHVLPHDATGVRRLAVLERHGHGQPPANGYVVGMGELHGAIASSVGHDSHNLIVVGDDTRDMRTALAALIECGGGFAVVQGGRVLARLPLPFGGLMSSASPEALRASIMELKAASTTIGCSLPDPFLQLAFLSLPVIPSLKLTNRGLVDVTRFELIGVRAA